MENVIILVLLFILVGIGHIFGFTKFTRSNVQRALTSVNISSNEVDNCLQWAFGDGYETQLFSAWNDMWNRRHGDIFTIHDCDLIQDSLKKIGRAYLQSRGGKI